MNKKNTNCKSIEKRKIREIRKPYKNWVLGAFSMK